MRSVARKEDVVVKCMMGVLNMIRCQKKRCVWIESKSVENDARPGAIVKKREEYKVCKQ